MHLWSRTVSLVDRHSLVLHVVTISSSDISFLCEATTAALTHDHNKTSLVPQRTTDKSAIRAVPNELQQEPVSSLRARHSP